MPRLGRRDSLPMILSASIPVNPAAARYYSSAFALIYLGVALGQPRLFLNSFA